MDVWEDFMFLPISDYIFKAIGERVFPLDANFISPEGDYITVKVAQIKEISWGDGNSYAQEDTGLKVYQTIYEADVRIVGYGNSAMGKLQSIVQGFREKNLTKILRDKDIACFKHLPVRDTSFGFDDKIEIRYETICSFRFIQSGEDRGDDPSYIETAGVTATYN